MAPTSRDWAKLNNLFAMRKLTQTITVKLLVEAVLNISWWRKRLEIFTKQSRRNDIAWIKLLPSHGDKRLPTGSGLWDWSGSENDSLEIRTGASQSDYFTKCIISQCGVTSRQLPILSKKIIIAWALFRGCLWKISAPFHAIALFFCLTRVWSRLKLNEMWIFLCHIYM